MIDWEALKVKSDILQFDEQLFAINAKKYKENIIESGEYLQDKKSILSIRAEIIRQEQELLKRKNEVRMKLSGIDF